MKDLTKILKSFQLRENLNPKIWKNGGQVMNPQVRERLLEISNNFIEELNVDIIVSDVIMTGSLANYNWSNFSDVDLHVVVDFNQFTSKTLPLYEELFKLKKTLYNQKHDITIYGYDVELYVQNEEETHFSSGVYSVLNDEWINKPKKEKVKIDTELIKNKIHQWMDIIDGVIENVKDEEIEDAKSIISKYKDKIKKYRTCGLEKEGEYSDENLVFKALRRNGYIEKLFNFENQLVDKKFTLKEKTENIGGTFKTDLENGPANHSKRALGNWQSDNAWDIFSPPGTVVNSYTDGTVISIRDTGKNSGKIFGTQVTINGENEYPDIFYTHLKNVKLQKGDTVKVGDYIGEISEWIGHEGSEHVHIGLPKGRHLRELLDNSYKIFNGRKDSDKSEKKSENPIKDKIVSDIKSLLKTSEFNDVDRKELKNNLIGITKGKNNAMKDFFELIKLNKDIEKVDGDGSSDKNIETLQKSLKFLGFLPVGATIDGKFNEDTENGVKQFQRRYGLMDDGSLKTEDLIKMFAVLALEDFNDSTISKIKKQDSEIYRKPQLGGPVNFREVTKKVINRIEGGYYNPDWHYKSAMGRSGETMFGIDRRHGGRLNTSPAGVEFWNLIDKNKSKNVWTHGYRGGNLEDRLTELVVDIMQPHYENLSDKYLSDDAKKVVNSSEPLLFHFIYAAWNGPGFFQKFANDINREVENGVKDEKELMDVALNSRRNSAVRNSADKIENIFDEMA